MRKVASKESENVVRWASCNPAAMGSRYCQKTGKENFELTFNRYFKAVQGAK